ncbi:hypothetical protein EAS64_10315 [Trebonia kvetii]|uniref:Uncharacterized protein n=1 Tax=Trebonia kvetii TaxID=2480626 RepID=A0A6P2C0R1_9ACTN|nr:hypothetical protein [Trebonia kvetii]TVZ05009.1 hypothetical protein EAS64_10315 [Trebonia kvetii]
MSHGGNPEAGTNSFIGIDGTALTITSPNGPDTWVIPVSDAFTVSMTWELTGIFAAWLAGLGLTYTVTYTFAGVGNANGTPLSVVRTTVAGQTTYGAPDTTVTVPANSLPVGTYEVLARVTFGGNPPMSAYIEIPVLDIY